MPHLERHGVAFLFPDVGARAIPALKQAALYFDKIECLSDDATLPERNPDARVFAEAGILYLIPSNEPIFEGDLNTFEKSADALTGLLQTIDRTSIRQMRRAYDEIRSNADGAYIKVILESTRAFYAKKVEFDKVARSGPIQNLAQMAGLSGREILYMMLDLTTLSVFAAKTPEYRGAHALFTSADCAPLATGAWSSLPFDNSVETVMRSLNLRIPFPTREELSTLSAERIVEFHVKHERQRRSFRDRVESVIKKLAEIDDPRMLRIVGQEEGNRINDEIADHLDLLKNHRMLALQGFLTLSCPSGITALSSHLLTGQPMETLVAGSLGMLLGGLFWFNKHTAEQKQISVRPIQYLLSLRKSLGR